MTNERKRATWWLTIALTGCANGNGGTYVVDSGAADTPPTVDTSAPDAATDAPAPIDASDDVATTPDVSAADVTAPDVTAPDATADVAVDVPVADVADVTMDVAPVDAGCGAVWPTCDARPTGATPATIAELWSADPPAPSLRWVSGAVVTAISHGACNTGFACQIFVQEPSATASLSDVAHHAIKVFISAASASRFAGIHVGDRVDVAASAWRYTIGGQNELLLQVADSCALRGCMARTGDGSVTATPATLTELGTVAAYERTYGPVLVQLTGVSATTDAATPLDSTTGGLFVTGAALDAGATVPVSVSPFFMPSGRFVGYTASQRLRFTSLTGVFGMFIPSATGDAAVPRFLQLYPRTPADLTLM